MANAAPAANAARRTALQTKLPGKARSGLDLRSQVRGKPFQQKEQPPCRVAVLFGGRYKTRTCGRGRTAPGVRSIIRAKGALKLVTSSRYTMQQKQNGHPFRDDRLFLVDDTRLELVTSRTSSGCATSCANRPSLCQLGHFTLSLCSCQAFFHHILRFASMRGRTSVDIILENGGHNYQNYLITAKNCNHFVPNYSVFWWFYLI